jgi:RNA polymerase sigma factor (sigma-70 family)
MTAEALHQAGDEGIRVATSGQTQRSTPEAGGPSGDEARLVRAAQQGDRSAFAALVEAYWDRLYRWLCHLTHDRHQAEDLAQETFLKAFAHLGKFKAGTNFRAWLFRIAHNGFANGCREAARRREALPAELPTVEQGPVEQALSREALREVGDGPGAAGSGFQGGAAVASRGGAVVQADRRRDGVDGGDGPLAGVQGAAEVAGGAGRATGTGATMNCNITQRLLLASEQIDRPDAAVSQHLARCPSCRAMQRRLGALERAIPQVPLPPSSGPGATIQKLMQLPPPVPARGPCVRLPRLPSPWGPREGGRQKLAVAFALAAALLVFAVGWWAWPHLPETRPNQGPDIADQRERQLERDLAAARTPNERVRILTRFADDLVEEARNRADDAEQVAKLARRFERAVGRELLVHAEAIPAKERAALLGPVRSRLGKTNSDAEKRAAEWESAGAAVASSWRTIAHAARDADRQLQRLA